jgi:hypothetical protein
MVAHLAPRARPLVACVDTARRERSRKADETSDVVLINGETICNTRRGTRRHHWNARCPLRRMLRG